MFTKRGVKRLLTGALATIMITMIAGVASAAPDVGLVPGGDETKGRTAAVQLDMKIMRSHDKSECASVDSIDSLVRANGAQGIRTIVLMGNSAPQNPCNVAEWARQLGPGGTRNLPVPLYAIEWGNEDSFSYKNTNATSYATSARNAYNAIRAANPNVLFLAQLDEANRGPFWIDTILSVWPQSRTAPGLGWTIHPYGPPSNGRTSRNITNARARGLTGKIHVTEDGMSTDNGRCLSDNYGWDRCMDYNEAALAIDQKLAHVASFPEIVTYLIYKGHDDRAPGVATNREFYFGVFQQSGASKGAYTTRVDSLVQQYSGTEPPPPPPPGQTSPRIVNNGTDPHIVWEAVPQASLYKTYWKGVYRNHTGTEWDIEPCDTDGTIGWTYFDGSDHWISPELAVDCPSPPPPPNQPPTVSDITYFPTAPKVGEEVLLSGNYNDPDGEADIVSRTWDLDNDGQFDDATGAVYNHIFTTAGVHRVGFRVADESDFAIDYQDITVVEPPPPAGTVPTVNLVDPTEGETVTGSTPFYATATDPEGIDRVEFFVDGTLRATEVTPPYGWGAPGDTVAPFNVSGLSEGSHVFKATAYDNAVPVESASDEATVIVDNVPEPPPPPPPPPPSGIGPGPVDLSTQGTVRTANTASGIVSAITASAPGDTVQVAAGTYGEISVNRNITSGLIRVVPATGATVTIAGVTLTGAQGLDFRGINTTTGDVWCVNSNRNFWRGGTHVGNFANTAFMFRDNCDNFTVEDVTVRNADVSFYFQAASNAAASDNNTIQRVRSENVSQDHVFVSFGTRINILRFEFFGHTDTSEHSDGVQVVGGKDMVVDRGHIWNTRAFRDGASDRNDHGLMINYTPGESVARVPERLKFTNLLIHDQTSTGISVAGLRTGDFINLTSFDNGGAGSILDPDTGNVVDGIRMANTVLNSRTVSGASFTLDSNNYIGTSPGFVNSGAQDYRPAAGSPLIDTGLASVAPPVDILGVPRTVPDRGAYEFVS